MRLMTFATTMFAVGLVSTVVLAGESSYTLDITRQGQTNQMVAYDFWSGEWPSPVLNVSSKVSGTTTVSGFRSLRTLDQPVVCEIENGLYHPWGDSPSLSKWYSIAPEVNYWVAADTTFEYYDVHGTTAVAKLLKGDVLKREIYLSEGFCQIEIPINGESVEVSYMCDATSAAELAISQGAGESEQWLYLACADGSKAFVRDTSLLAQPGVTEGQFGEYGTVKP